MREIGIDISMHRSKNIHKRFADFSVFEGSGKEKVECSDG